MAPPRPANRTALPAARPIPAGQRLAEAQRLERTLLDRVAAQPDSALHWQQLAGLYAQTGRNAEASEAFGKAVAKGASAQAVALPWALALSNLGRHEEAVAVLQPAQARKPK
jgi:predicted Zn-dependent protease